LHTFSFKFDLKVLIRESVFDLVILKVINQLRKHVRSLVSAEELRVFALLVLIFASLKHLVARVLALLGAVIDVQVDLAADFSTSANTLSGRLPFFRKPVSFSLSLFRFINALMSNLELVLHLMLSGMLALHPGVSDDVGHRQPLVGMILEHTGDKILEFFREEARFMALALQFPEEVSPVRCDQFVLQIVGKSL